MCNSHSDNRFQSATITIQEPWPIRIETARGLSRGLHLEPAPNIRLSQITRKGIVFTPGHDEAHCHVAHRQLSSVQDMAIMTFKEFAMPPTQNLLKVQGNAASAAPLAQSYLFGSCPA